MVRFSGTDNSDGIDIAAFGFKHNKYDDRVEFGAAFDYGFAILSQPILESFKPAVLPSEGFKFVKGDVVEFMGYGKTDAESEIKNNRLYKGKGLLKSKDFPTTLTIEPHPDHPNQMVCNGDSGGPLYLRNISGKPILMGVTSGSHPSERRDDAENCKGLTLFADVWEYLLWMNPMFDHENGSVQILEPGDIRKFSYVDIDFYGPRSYLMIPALSGEFNLTIAYENEDWMGAVEILETEISQAAATKVLNTATSRTESYQLSLNGKPRLIVIRSSSNTAKVTVPKNLTKS